MRDTVTMTDDARAAARLAAATIRQEANWPSDPDREPWLVPLLNEVADLLEESAESGEIAPHVTRLTTVVLDRLLVGAPGHP